MANPMLFGRLLYAVPVLEITPLFKNVLHVIEDEKNIKIEASIINEAVFESKPNKYHYYTTHNNSNPDHREKNSLRRVPSIYC